MNHYASDPALENARGGNAELELGGPKIPGYFQAFPEGH